jgi:hypothetical protein
MIFLERTKIAGLLAGIIILLAIVYGTLQMIAWHHPTIYPRQDLGKLPGKMFQNKSGKFKVLMSSSLEKILQDGGSITEPNFEDRVQVSVARNEFESFQLAIFNVGNQLQRVHFNISELKTPDGRSLENNAVSWRIVGYVPTKKPHYHTKYVGMWPDPLLPARPATIRANSVQPFWFTIFIGSETPSGIYKGSIEVLEDENLLATIPVRIEVYPFVLPGKSTLKTAFDFYDHLTSKRYPKQIGEHDSDYRARIDRINDSFIVSMLQFRMNPILNMDLRSEKEQLRLTRYISLGLTNFAVGKHGGSFNNKWPLSNEGIDALGQEYQSFSKTLAAFGLSENPYVYVWDEKEMGSPRIAKIAAMIHQASPQLRNMVTYQGFWEPKKFPNWGNDIDIWAFNLTYYNPKLYESMVRMGKEMWIYVSGPGSDGAPDLVIDADSIEYRIIPWMCWKFGIKGFLYWCVNWWPVVDPFESAANTDWNQNGNGLLFYSGKDGPVASLRAEIFRDGMEDYEYLILLRNLVKKFEEKGLERKYAHEYAMAKDLLNPDDGILESFTKFTRRPTNLLTYRKRMAEEIILMMELNRTH